MATSPAWPVLSLQQCQRWLGLGFVLFAGALLGALAGAGQGSPLTPLLSGLGLVGSAGLAADNPAVRVGACCGGLSALLLYLLHRIQHVRLARR